MFINLKLKKTDIYARAYLKQYIFVCLRLFRFTFSQ